MGRKYQNPPVEEAVCEFRFTADTQWDITVPGLVYELLKDEFPDREPRLFQEVEITQGREGVQQQIRTTERIVLYAPERKQFVQIGHCLLAVNVLRPYPTWLHFKPKIEKAWSSVCKVVEVKGLERIGLRYINLIEIPEQEVKFEHYFEFYPFLGSDLPQQVSNFLTIVEFSFEDGRDRCRISLAPGFHETRRLLFLDLDYFSAFPKAVEVSQVLDWVENAHNRVENIFEGCITDVLRERFGLQEE